MCARGCCLTGVPNLVDDKLVRGTLLLTCCYLYSTCTYPLLKESANGFWFYFLVLNYLFGTVGTKFKLVELSK